HLAAAGVNVSNDTPRKAVVGFHAGKGFGLVKGHFGKAQFDHFGDVSLVNSGIVAVGCDSVCVSGDGCRGIGSLLDSLDCTGGCVVCCKKWSASGEQASSNC